MTDTKRINQLWRKGREFLGVDYPIICGAMTWVSTPHLVATVCNAGAFGVLAGGNMPTELLAKDIDDTRTLTKKPFGVNLITIAPNYPAHLELACRKKAPFIIFAGSFPRTEEIQQAKDSGAKVICFASTDSIAERMIKYGTDGLMLEGSESGGHIGPVSLIVLLQEVLFKFKDQLPIFAAGGIATGQMMAHLLLMGASGIQMGTRFVMSPECQAHPEFKEAFLRAKARDAMATPQFDSALPVVSVRALYNEGTIAFGKLQMELIKKLEAGAISRKEAQFEVERFWMGALKKAVVDGDVKRGSLMAGQSVGLVKDIKPIKEIISQFIADAAAELDLIHSNTH
ncbi:MAG: nitronate monooxygenase [Planctomycetes bacterium]|nr:nitronate monooxygenase [Planctomycetota bacterium]